MGKRFFRLLCICLLSFLTLGLTNFTEAKTVLPAGCQIMKVTGEAAQGMEDDRAQAMLKAKQKAVKKALQILGVTPSKDPGSRYVLLANNCEQYLCGDIKVDSSKHFGDKTVLFCQVPVDVVKLKRDVEQVATLEQKQQFGDKPIFLIRIVGLTDREQQQTLPNKVANIYAQAFRNQGFQVGAPGIGNEYGPDTAELVANAQNVGNTYDEYCAEIEQLLQEQVAVPIIVTGEVRIKQVRSYGESGYAEAECHFDALVRNARNNLQNISCFNDYYNASRLTAKEAVAIVAQTAALNSAQRLADATYNYWVKKKVKE